jgi:large subunit ribosomal protein L30
VVSKKKSAGKSRRLKITQIRSANGRPETHRRTLKALGLRHQHSVIHDENEAIKGMLFQVRHLVDVQELEGEGK